MLNLDMIGRIRDGRVFVSGAQTGTTLEKILDEVKPPAPLHIDESGRNSGTNMNDASDHASFASKQIPVLFFFSGLHADYHKPSDTADKIDAVDAAKLLDYIADITTHLSDAPDRPTFVRVVRPSAGPISAAAGQSGYGPDFGSIPDFNEPPTGVRFADIREGSPASKAGLKAGDIMIEFDGKPIGNLYDFTYALREHKPGDLVQVKVLRGDQKIEAKVLLTERR
jgi:aminopeptidase YwaD